VPLVNWNIVEVTGPDAGILPGQPPLDKYSVHLERGSERRKIAISVVAKVLNSWDEDKIIQALRAKLDKGWDPKDTQLE